MKLSLKIFHFHHRVFLICLEGFFLKTSLSDHHIHFSRHIKIRSQITIKMLFYQSVIPQTLGDIIFQFFLGVRGLYSRIKITDKFKFTKSSVFVIFVLLFGLLYLSLFVRMFLWWRFSCHPNFTL